MSLSTPTLTPPAAVTTTRDGAVLVATIHNPPVNALNAEVRGGLLRAAREADADAQVRALLLVGAGRGFIAGADIREFGKPPVPPSLPETCAAIEGCSKPVIAALHGATLGGGLEVAMAAHYRFAVSDTKLGLPEVQLGLIPGSGGTQRAPRLMGLRPALDLMLSGRHMDAKEAAQLGLVDRLGEGSDALAAGVAYANALIADGAGPRRTGERALGEADARETIAAVRAEIAPRTRGLFSPAKVLDAVEAGLELPFEQALLRERELFLQCVDSPQRAGLVHAFFAEREAAKAPEARQAQARPIACVGVVGGGTMGAGIAVALLDAGLRVTMVERDAASVARGRANVEKVYDGLLAKGRMTPEAKAAVMARLAGSDTYDALGEADLVIEAVFEDMSVKQAVFAALDAACKRGAILATNTSYLDIDALAASVSRPQDVIGLHFFSPANIMKLLEVVVPAKVAPDVVVTAFELAKKLRKIAVRAGVCDGFIGNRILASYRQAADALMEDGASPYEIDEAVRAFGFPMGPYQVSDLAGGDIAWASRKRRAPTRDPRARYVQIPDRLCERGWFGQKTGRGYYLYEKGARAGTHDPDVLAVIDAERARAGVAPRRFSAQEIQRRYVAAMVNEGARVLQEGIALRPLDIDVALMHGYGFPRYRGGPMHYADTVGLRGILADIREFANDDPLFWQAAPLLVGLVEQGKSFGSLNEA